MDRATYEAMGRAALLPGIQYAVEQMQKMLDDMREALAGLQNGHAPDKRKVGRPRKSEGELFEQRKKIATGTSSYWAKMTPEERTAEMDRRRANGLGTKPKGKQSTAALRTAKMPLKVGDEFTQQGLAKELGFAHAHSYENWRRRQKERIPSGRRARIDGFRAPVRLYSEADLAAIRNLRKERAA